MNKEITMKITIYCCIYNSFFSFHNNFLKTTDKLVVNYWRHQLGLNRLFHPNYSTENVALYSNSNQNGI